MDPACSLAYKLPITKKETVRGLRKKSFDGFNSRKVLIFKV